MFDSASTPKPAIAVTPEAANALAEQLRGMGKSVEIVVYPGADHAFFNDTRPEVYDAGAARELAGRTRFPTPEPVALEESDGRWLIASPARLGSIDSCAIHNIRPSRCTANARVLMFGIILTSAPPEPSLPPIPVAVKRAGGEQLVDFKSGRTVYAQSGCAACHRLGDVGNAGPGPNLTHIGSTLSTPQLEYAIIDPRAPMPSFSHLPAAKFKAVVEFLSLLR